MENSRELELFLDSEHEQFNPSNPERNLLAAVLMSAINDYSKEGAYKRKAKAFFLSSEDDYVFSFNKICQFLDLDPDKVLVVTGIEKIK